MRYQKIVLCTLGMAGLFGFTAELQAKRSYQALLDLSKVTVGPFDNFQSSIDETERFLFYTRSQNLSTQIIKLDLKSGISSAITEIQSDAKDPAVSPDGSRLAFTSFRDDAQGDICVLAGKEIRCVTGRDAAEHSPFWISDERLGFAQTKDGGRNNKIIEFDFKSGQKRELVSGFAYSPSASPDGRQLIYSNERREVILFDLADKRVNKTLKFDLPGITGAAKISADGKYIYFPQYLIDSNRDQKLDSRDMSAIYRVALNGDNLPEALTSVQQDCAYPFPTRSALYVSCAFEGALDIYRLPLTGLIPDSWTVKDVVDAHRVARTYSDRILLLSQWYARFKGLERRAFLERVMYDFIFMRSWLTASYYADTLSKDPGNSDPKFAAHKVLLDSLVRWEALPSKEQITELNQIVEEQTARLESLKDSPLKRLASGYLLHFAHKDQEAFRIAEAITSDDPMTLYWQTRLIELLSTGTRAGAYGESLERRIATESLSEENRLFYFSRWLERLPAPQQDAKTRVATLRGRLAARDQGTLNILELLDNEEQLRRVVAAKTVEDGRVDMRGIVERAKKLKDHDYALRLLFARGLVVLDKGQKTRELSMLMSLWLSYVKPGTKEFPYVVEALRLNSLDVAYKFYNGPEANRPLAIGAFNDSLRTTDDLESIYQYVLLQSTDAGWKELEKNFNSMIKDGLIATESLTFAKTVRSILKSDKPVSEGDLKDAIDFVESIDDQHVGVGVKYLFLGYLNHRLLLLGKGSPDRDLAEKTHRGYLFAIDAAWNNERIKASAYQNLGLLHLTLRNWSLAADFLTKRHELGFLTKAQKLAIYWVEAEALFKSYRSQEAKFVMEQALAQNPEPKAAFIERHAFYAWNAGEYQAAVKSYDDFFASSQSNAGSYLSYGYVLMKLKRLQAAEAALTKAIELSEKSKSRLSRDGLVVDPLKTAFVARGLRARLELGTEKRIAYLEDRLKSFDVALKHAKTWYFDERTLSGQKIKEMFDLTMLRITAGDKIGAAKDAERAVLAASSFGDDHGYLNQTIFVSLKNFMLLSRDNKIQLSSASQQALDIMVKGVDEEVKKDKSPGISVRREWAEVQMIAAAYGCALSKCAKSSSQKKAIDGVIDSEIVKSLERDLPGSIATLKTYGDGVFRF